LTCINRAAPPASKMGHHSTEEADDMGGHAWAREALERELNLARAAGFDEAMALRADNLDDERDYAFMRP